MNTVDVEPEQLSNIRKAYYADSEGLGSMASRGVLANIIKDLSDYPSFLRDNNKQSKKLLKTLFKNNDSLNAAANNSDLKKVFYAAHMAVCCELFNGWKLPLNALNSVNMQAYVDKSLSNISDVQISELETRVHVSDTIRTCQILRLLGLFTRNTDSTRQISLAAGPGTRDINGFHSTPELSLEANPLIGGNSEQLLSFQNHYTYPELTVLIDNDTEYADVYERLNNDSTAPVLALNEDSDSALSKLPGIMTQNDWKPINVVAGFRIDHRMIPDVPAFFKQLVPVLDDMSDLIITVGAGHSLEEFIGRKKVMRDLQSYLNKRGMSARIITLHEDHKQPEEQRNAPYFGYSPYTTYEILHCKLKKKKLS